MVRGRVGIALFLLGIFILSVQSPIALQQKVENPTQGRAQTVWSGTVVLNNHHTIPITDELVISPCTNITMANGIRIYVEGRLLVEGTTSCPVYFDYAGGGDHMGIQFNSTSNGRGSRIDNASFVHATYGITIYNSDPYIANVTLWNPDDVGIDMFNSATPTIRDLVVNQAGQDWNFPTYWRYGIALSIGASSAPNIDRVTINDVVTRGLNIWGNSGGIIRNVSIANVTGATLAQAAGVWVEDSVPLIEHIDIDKSDHGLIVRHMDDGSITRAVIRDMNISNSMYKAVILDKDDRTNYTNYQSAIIEGLTVSGTGTSGAKTPGLATATIEINATGAWIEDAYLENNDAVGIQMYFVDSSTVFTNLKINNTGGSGTGANAAGISVRSSYFAAKFNGLEVSNSTGPGIFALNGGAIQGNDWNLHNNGKEGFYLESAATIVDGLELSNNGDSGVHINDARYVYLSNLTSYDNAEAGMEFTKANDIESSSGDVRCTHCTVLGNSRGVSITDSVDIYLTELNVHDPLSGSAIDIDNQGLNIGIQGGLFNLHDVKVWTNNTGPAIKIVGAEGVIDGLDMYGNHSGLDWDADHNVERTSILSNANLTGSGCLNLSNHDQLTGSGNIVETSCTGELNFVNTKLNWTGFKDESSHVLNVDTNSNLHLHQPLGVDYTSANIDGNGWIEESWDLLVWVINNNSNGVPNSAVILNFDQLENSISNSTNYDGYVSFPDLRGKKYFSAGQSPYTTVTIDCAYSGVANSTNITLNQDQIVWCQLPLANQPPFIVWDTPTDQSIFPSKSEVNFNASSSWDLDDDVLTFKWTSSLDGVLFDGFVSEFTANPELNVINSTTLSDGVHSIELEVCDVSYCTVESRTIELSNQPPVIVVDINPALSPWGELIAPITKPVHFDLNGTYDPEGDVLNCSWEWLEFTQQISDCSNATGELSFANVTIFDFDLKLVADDGVNTPSVWEIPVELFNEVPISSFEIIRLGNYSQDEITLQSTTVDPEGDNITYLWESSIDGILSNQSLWQGHLSRGNHVISLSVNDGRMEHLNSTSTNSTVLIVENSPPVAIIHGLEESGLDSSISLEFNASGSGDWDSACSTFPAGIDWHCSPTEPASGSEYLIYKWESDKDGLLQENGTDWLIFNGHLTSGTHQITLTIDDGINPAVTTTKAIEISPSAPVLVLSSPDLSVGYPSNELIEFDLQNSIDYDGDTFSVDLSSDIQGEIFTNKSVSEVQKHLLDAGLHTLTFTLTDSTGNVRVEEVELTIVESDPDVMIYEPQNNQFYEPGELVILDSNGTFDADNDITRREWRLYENGALYPVVLSNDEYHSVRLFPGVHHLSLYVEDRRGGFDEEHVNITVASSSPDLSNLSATPNSVFVDELVVIEVRIELDDPDGTTSIVNATIIRNLQTWNFNLSDDDGDGIWYGAIEILPQEKGKAQLKVTAFDGGNIDYITINIEFVEEEIDNTSVYIATASIGIFILVSVLFAGLVIRRRRRLADIDLIDSWGVFGSESEELEDEELEA